MTKLVARKELVLVCHTGQHYDHRYSGAMLEEFGLPVDIHLGIEGSLTAKTAQMIDSFGRVLAELRALGLTPLPYIHGDTATSMAIGVASYLSQVACVHVEAGIRTITPRREVLAGFLGRLPGLVHSTSRRTPLRTASWRRTRRGAGSPSPSSSTRGYRMPRPAITPLRSSWRGRICSTRAFAADTIEVVGNTVVDATRQAQADARRATVFDDYPQLRGGRFIRICIHRRENTEDEHRFTVLFEAIETLVNAGRPVLFIRLFGTDAAIDRFGLRDRLTALEKAFPESFISTEVWPNYRDVIAAMQECALVATDSGSMQEEMNILGVGCVTLRFGSDRGETSARRRQHPGAAGGFSIRGACDRAGRGSALSRSTYPICMAKSVAASIVDGVLARAVPGPGLFRTEESRLGLPALGPNSRTGIVVSSRYVDEPALPMVCTPWEVQVALHTLMKLRGAPGASLTPNCRGRRQPRQTLPSSRCWSRSMFAVRPLPVRPAHSRWRSAGSQLPPARVRLFRHWTG